MKKISVVIVEDHQLVREMWTSLFAESQEIEVIGESGAVDEAVEIIRTKTPDVVLLDINLPQGSGIDAVPLIRQFAPSSKIIAVSMHDQPTYAKKMLQLGVSGYVTKNSPHQEMLQAIEDVMNGKTYLCLEIKNNLSGRKIKEEGAVSTDGL